MNQAEIQKLNARLGQHRAELDRYQASMPSYVGRSNSHPVSDEQLMAEAFAVNYGEDVSLAAD
jgi:hypothetical protein